MWLGVEVAERSDCDGVVVMAYVDSSKFEVHVTIIEPNKATARIGDRSTGRDMLRSSLVIQG